MSHLESTDIGRATRYIDLLRGLHFCIPFRERFLNLNSIGAHNQENFTTYQYKCSCRLTILSPCSVSLLKSVAC